jgi:hypothetical protein
LIFEEICNSRNDEVCILGMVNPPYRCRAYLDELSGIQPEESHIAGIIIVVIVVMVIFFLFMVVLLNNNNL